MNYDVLVVGNPLMDRLAFVDDKVLLDIGILPGSMVLVGMSEITNLMKLTNEAVMVSGGSETNTAVGVAEFGGTVKLLGALADDDVGELYKADLEKYPNIRQDFEVYSLSEYGHGTGVSLVLVSPNGERTMLTYLGASALLGVRSLDKITSDVFKVIYFDAYLLDLPDGKAIVQKLVSYAKGTRAKILFGLADVNVVGRHHEEIMDLISKTDILLANEAEVNSLAGVDDPLKAIEQLAKYLPKAAITLGEKGSLIYDDSSFLYLDAPNVSEVVDTTGAGDQFAAGICFGVARDMLLKDSAVIGMEAATEVISHIGARPTPGWAASLAVGLDSEDVKGVN